MNGGRAPSFSDLSVTTREKVADLGPRVTGEKTKTLLVPPMGAIALVGGTMLPVVESSKVYRRQQNEKVIF